MTLQTTFVVAFLAVIVLVVAPSSSSPSFYSSTLTSPPDNPSPPFKTQYFQSQVIDHFNFQTNSLGNNTWTQRYLVWDDAYYSNNISNNSNPIFFYTGNEGTCPIPRTHLSNRSLSHTRAPHTHTHTHTRTHAHTPCSMFLLLRRSHHVVLQQLWCSF